MFILDFLQKLFTARALENEIAVLKSQLEEKERQLQQAHAKNEALQAQLAMKEHELADLRRSRHDEEQAAVDRYNAELARGAV